MTQNFTSKNETLQAALTSAKRLLIRAGVFSLFANLLMLSGPIYMLQIYDRVLSSRSIETLVVLTLLIFFLFAAFGALDFVRAAILARTGTMFENDVQNLTFDLSMDAARAADRTYEQPLRDLRQIRQFLASPALVAFFDAPMTPFFLLLIFLMHWMIGIVATIGLFILLGMALMNERWSRNELEKAQSMSQASDAMATAVLRNAFAADAMGMRKRLRDRWLETGEGSHNQIVLAGDRMVGVTASAKATRLFLQSAILGVGAYLAIGQEITPGVMVAASIIAGRALAPVEIVTSQWRNYASAMSSYSRLKTFLEAGAVPGPRTKLPEPVGAIDVSRLYIQPLTVTKPIIKNVSFQLAPGEALGIVGPSAAGKSTLARALVGVERVVSGDIRLDGADLKQWDRDLLGAHVGYLPQNIELFDGTVAENISRFRTDATSDKIVAAGKAAGAHEMVLSLPNGYETQMGDNGGRLSAGQRQRVGLARAVYDDPVLVVLDEPNSYLDAEGEAALIRAMQSLKARRATTIIIAHRPSAIAFVDKLLMLTDGAVAAFGPRDEVLKKIAPGLVARSEGGAKERPQGALGNG